MPAATRASSSLQDWIPGRGARDAAGIVLELRFKAFQQGERVGTGAGETDEDFSSMQFANLVSVGFHHGLAQRHLTVAADGRHVAMANREDCRGADSLHLRAFRAIL